MRRVPDEQDALVAEALGDLGRRRERTDTLDPERQIGKPRAEPDQMGDAIVGDPRRGSRAPAATESRIPIDRPGRLGGRRPRRRRG